MKKRIAAFLCSLVLGATMLTGDIMTVCAEEPYDSYSFNYWGDEVLQPHAYLYGETLSWQQFGTKLSYPADMCRYEDALYVADTGNSRILKLSLEGQVLQEIKAANGAGDALKNPQGIFLTEEGHLYVADSGNARVVEYDENGSYLRSIGRPVTNLISDSQEYKPTKVVVDHAGRIYVIAYGINMGLVEFDKNGVFQGFMGAAEVSVSRLTYIWKNYFSTQEQQARMETIVPTEYSNIYVDDENFIYATINNLTLDDVMNNADAIRRLNPTGTDVLRRLANYSIVGDINIPYAENVSSFCDVAATDYGCYFVLDNNGGKVFAYDYDGNSLFAFGKKGMKEGNVRKPSAIALGENEKKIYILDETLGSILVYDLTQYGQDLLEAIRLNDTGDAQGANACWQKVLRANSNNELAYIGLGKTYLSEVDYRKAMEYFRLGNSRKYYTKAFYYYRKEVMEANFGKAMAAIGILVVVIVAVQGTRRFKRWVGEVRCSISEQ